MIAGALVTLASCRMVPIEDIRIGDEVLGARDDDLDCVRFLEQVA
jgi:hypothetical protein